MADYLKEFVAFLTEQKKASSNTLESYSRDLSQFMHFLGNTDLSAVTEESIQRYIAALKRAGKSQSTITRTISSVRTFYKFMILQGYIDRNPVMGIHVEKPKRQLPAILTGKEVDLLLAQPDESDPKGCRDKAMLEVLYATGIRVGELVDLQLDDVNLQLDILHCRNEKNERMAPLYPSAAKALKDYIKWVRPILAEKPDESALFLNMSGGRLTRQGFWKIIKSYAQKAKIKKDITPHTVRHSFATHLLENGASLKDIQEMMGYADISSTQVYANAIQEKYSTAYKKYHPKVAHSR